jgi:hypothetical protein
MQAAAMKVAVLAVLLLLGVAGHFALAREANTSHDAPTASTLPATTEIGLSGELGGKTPRSVSVSHLGCSFPGVGVVVGLQAQRTSLQIEIVTTTITTATTTNTTNTTTTTTTLSLFKQQ